MPFIKMRFHDVSCSFILVFSGVCVCIYTHTKRCEHSETGNRGRHSSTDSQMKSVSVSLCGFALLYCVSILSSSSVYLTEQSAKPAIAFEQRQRFWCSYRPSCRRRGLSMAKSRLRSRASFSLQVIYYSRLHLISGQQVDSWPRGSSIPTSGDTSVIPIMITRTEGKNL